MKYSIHISYLTFHEGETIEEQVVKQFSCFVPAVLYYIKTQALPWFSVEEIPYNSMILRKFFDVRINFYKD